MLGKVLNAARSGDAVDLRLWSRQRAMVDVEDVSVDPKRAKLPLELAPLLEQARATSSERTVLPTTC